MPWQPEEAAQRNNGRECASRVGTEEATLALLSFFFLFPTSPGTEGCIVFF